MSKTIRTAIVLALAATPVMAQAASESTSSGGMPQLDFGNPWTIAQVVWMLIIFGLLYYVMARVALPQMAEVLEARRLRIEGDLENAQRASHQADAALAELHAATAKARAEAQSAIAEATQQAQAESHARSEALNAKLTAQIEAAEKRIDTSRIAALGALRQVATDTAEAVVGRLIGPGDRGMVERAVDRELAARGRA